MTEDADTAFQQLFKSGVFVLLGLFFELGLSFVAKLLMARVLPKVDYGIISIGITVLNVTVALSLIGVNSGLSRYLPRSDEPAYKRGVIVSAAQLVTPTVLVASISVFFFADLLAANVFKNPAVAPIIRLFAVGIPFMALMKFTLGVVQGLKMTVPKIVIENLVVPGSRFALIFVALYLGYSVTGAGVAYVVAYALGAVVGVAYVLRDSSILECSGATPIRRELLAFSAPLFAMTALDLIFSDLDTFMLGYYVTTSAIAEYHVVYPISQLLTTFLGAFSFLFLPVFSGLHSEERRKEMTGIYQTVTKWILVATLPIFLATVFFPETVIALTFGGDYRTAAPALAVLAVGFFVHAVLGLNGHSLISIGKTRLVMYDNAAAAVLNFGLNLLLIPRLGIVGAAVATTAAYLLLTILYSTHLYRLTGIHPFSRNLVQISVGTAGLFAAAYFVTTFFPIPSIYAMTILAAVFAPIYAVVLLRYGTGEEELMLLGSIEHKFDVNLTWIRSLVKRFDSTR